MATKQLKLSDFYSKKDHGHGNITKDGAIGSTPNLPVITGNSGKLQASSFGTAANTFCQGNDLRLSDSRVPVFTHLGASVDTPKDLDTFKTGGFYYCDNDRNQAVYIDNCPLPKAENKCFFLLVETWGTTSPYYTKQTLTYYNTNKTYIRTCAGQVWGPWDELKKTFDFVEMKGTDNTVGYVKPLKFTIGKSYQDKPIEIEIYQRNRNEKCTVQIAFNNVSTNDPGINKLTHTGHNINIYLYKEGTGTWSLITSKGHNEKYGEMSVKISNPNTGINITRQDVHLASLPTSNLTTSTYIGFTQDEKTKLAGIATGANKTTIANNLTTTTAGSALDATQGKELKTLVDGKAPTSHASTATTYGVSTTANYGHTKIVQNLTTDDGNGLALGAGQGKALKGLVDGKAPTSHASTATTYGAGNASNYGHVRVADNYTTSAGNASQGVAASSAAVKAAYDKGNHDHPYISTTAGSVGTSNLANNAVTNDKISNGTITSLKIADEAIGTQEIKDSNVTTAKIADSNVTTAKIANSAVTSAKIADGTIVNGDISSSAAIAYSKLSGVASSGHVHGWKTLKTYNENNKVIVLKVNEKTKLAYVHVSYKTTTNYTNPPYIIDIATQSWFSVSGFATEFGATSHNAVLYYNNDTGILSLKLIGPINSGVTIVGSITFPYVLYDGEST